MNGFEAKYPGICRECEQDFDTGEVIKYDEDSELVHQTCPDTGNWGREVCGVCWLQVPANGKCECDNP